MTPAAEAPTLTPATHRSVGAPFWIAMALLGGLWFSVINQVRLEWSLNEQYMYGWAVPVLCLYLLWERWRAHSIAQEAVGGVGGEPNRSFTTPLVFLTVLPLLAAVFVFGRLIAEANPDWRLVSWLLAMAAVGITLSIVGLLGGRALAREAAFPISFFLVAVPWPTLIEQPVIQGFTRFNASATAEVLNAFGIVAMQRGNLIETAGGIVDVDEACSGIRSLQAALMISLFFGELKRLNVWRRGGLVLAAVGVAGLLNLMRTLLLSLLAARQGVAALGKWHDPLGVGILVGCFIGIWIVAHFFSRNVAPPARSLPVQNRQHAGAPHRSVGRWTILMTAAILVFGEVGVRAWYASRRVVTSDLQWTLELPTDRRDFEPVPIAPVVFRFLRFNEGHSARWRNADGTLWQLFYFRWDPGRTAVHLARGHTPEICLPAAGHKLLAMSHVNDVRLGSVRLPFRSFMSGTHADPLFVFYTIWEEGLSTQNVASEKLTWSARWTFVKERRRNPGQRVIQVGIRGAGTMAEAEASLRRELPKIVRLDRP